MVNLVLSSSQFFWSFDTPETPGSVFVVFAGNQSENEIWNGLKQFFPVCFISVISIIWESFDVYNMSVGQKLMILKICLAIVTLMILGNLEAASE
jgi:hypothetical protein